MVEKLTAVFVQRKIANALEQIGRHLEQQNQILARLAERLAPDLVQDPLPRGIKSVDYAQDGEQARIQDLAEQMLRSEGRMPTDEEIVERLEGKS